jgi:predicted ArsR family transcriptional regulator
VNSSDEDVLRFIAASFPSVWALELLIILRQERRSWSRSELVTELHASELVVAKALDALVAAGLASIENDGAAYLPANATVEACVGRAEQLYRSRPNAVRRTIISANTSSAAAFADAFRIRKGSDD